MNFCLYLYMYIYTHTDQYLKRGCVSEDLYFYSYTHSAVNTLTRPWSSVLFFKIPTYNSTKWQYCDPICVVSITLVLVVS